MLRLSLLSAAGEKGKNRYDLKDGKGERDEARRFYHVRVSNERRLLSPAEAVQVSLLRIEQLGPGGLAQVTWAGEVPMTWRNQQVSPLTRTIGQDYDCDLCSVGKDLGLSLALLIFPINVPVQIKEACKIIVSLKAKGVRTDSPICRIEIGWNGKWDDGDDEMTGPLEIKQLEDEIE